MEKQTICKCGRIVTFPETAQAGDSATCECGEIVKIGAPAQQRAAAGGNNKKLGLIIGAAVILAVVVAALAGLLSGGGASEEGWDLIPRDVAGIATIDMARAVDIPGINEAVKQMEAQSEGLALREMGLSMSNLSRVYIGIPREGMQGDSQPEPMMLVQSLKALDEKTVIESLEADGQISRREDVAGITGYHLARSEMESSGMMLFARKDMLAFGAPDMVRMTGNLAAGKDNNSVRNNRELMKLAQSAGSGDLFWVAYIIPEGVEDDMFGAPKTVFARGNYSKGKGLRIDADLAFAGKDEANEAETQLRPTLAFMAMMFGLEEKDLVLKVDGSSLKLAAQISDETLKKMTSQGQP